MPPVPNHRCRGNYGGIEIVSWLTVSLCFLKEGINHAKMSEHEGEQEWNLWCLFVRAPSTTCALPRCLALHSLMNRYITNLPGAPPHDTAPLCLLNYPSNPTRKQKKKIQALQQQQQQQHSLALHQVSEGKMLRWLHPINRTLVALQPSAGETSSLRICVCLCVSLCAEVGGRTAEIKTNVTQPAPLPNNCPAWAGGCAFFSPL